MANSRRRSPSCVSFSVRVSCCHLPQVGSLFFSLRVPLQPCGEDHFGPWRPPFRIWSKRPWSLGHCLPAPPPPLPTACKTITVSEAREPWWDSRALGWLPTLERPHVLTKGLFYHIHPQNQPFFFMSKQFCLIPSSVRNREAGWFHSQGAEDNISALSLNLNRFDPSPMWIYVLASLLCNWEASKGVWLQPLVTMRKIKV